MDTQTVIDSVKHQTPAALIPEALAFAGLCWVLYDKNQKYSSRKAAFRNRLPDDLNVNSGTGASLSALGERAELGDKLDRVSSEAERLYLRTKSAIEILANSLSREVKSTSHKALHSDTVFQGSRALSRLGAGSRQTYAAVTQACKDNPKTSASAAVGIAAVCGLAAWAWLDSRARS